MRYFIILFALISFISGCGKAYVVRHAYVTNYAIKEEQTSYIGQSIVKVKDYYVYKEYASTFLTPTDDFVLTANAPSMLLEYKLKIIGLKGKGYQAYGKVKIDGIMYDLTYIIDSNRNNSYGILIDDQGALKSNTLYYKNIAWTSTDFTIQPSTVKFTKMVTNNENFVCDVFINYLGNTCGWTNYELIYSGINNVSMNFTYREYSRNDYARPAFYQNLTYEPNTKQIRFKDFQIEILEANNDKITYKVMADGLKQTEFLDSEDPGFMRIK